MAALRDALGGKRVVVCVGSGGVGKTTVAAALALSRAQAGEKVLVCTIDPARRLASALGLAALGNAESQVPAEAFARAGLSQRGQLWAMMLDVKRTWDDLIARHAPSPGQRDRILRSRIYQQVSGALAGSQEYMAMEKLHELACERDYDLVVLDTPPTAHALDFLEAPDRILDFLDNDTARILLTPAIGAGRLGLRLFQIGGSYVAKTLARFTGSDVLQDISDFMAGFEGMYDGFKARAAAVRALLGRPDVGFVLVAGPSPLSVDEALFFHDHLVAESMPVAGVVVNRVTPDLWPAGGRLPTPAELASALGEAGNPSPGAGGDGPAPAAGRPGGDAPGDLASRLSRTLAEHQRLARADGREVRRLFEATTGARAVVPRLETDVHDLGGLAAIAAWM
jgi:anion-transporting  ArsA/GET3 family ATPase